MLPRAISMQRLFAAVIILKIGFSVAGWLIGSFFGIWILGFAVPLALMAAYVAAGLYRRDRDELSDEKFADSCYYLGFIFTISSIIVSLFDLPAIADRLGDIAVRFGAAMITTVAGLVVRVLIVNLRRDLTDIEKSLEQDLLAAEHAFRTHLELAVDRLRAFEGIVDDGARKAMARIELSIEDSVKAYSDRFQGLFEKIAADNRRRTEESAAHAQLVSDKLDEILSDHATALVRSMNGLQACMESFAAGLDAKLKKTDFPGDYFARSLAEPVFRLRATMEQIATEVADLSGALRHGSTRVGAALERMGQQADAVTLRLEQVNALIGERSRSERTSVDGR
jgi:hypothetical protein